MSSLVIRPQNKRRYYYLGASLLLIGLGIMRLFESVGSGDTNGKILGIEPIAGLMMFAGLLWGLSTLQTLMRRRDAVVMNDDGVAIWVPAVGFIEWNEIAAVRTDMVRGRSYLHIILRDPAAAIERQPSLERHMAEGEVWFDASEIDMSPRELADTIIERRNTARSS